MMTANQLAAWASSYHMMALENADWETGRNDCWRAAFAAIGAIKTIEWSEWHESE